MGNPLARSQLFTFDVYGEMAVFCAGFHVERYSLDVMPPTAGKGVFECVLGKKELDWHVVEIQILQPIHRTSFMINEVKGKPKQPFLVYASRTQRMTTALVDVGYRVTAYFTLSSHAREEDSIPKFETMFRTRMTRGQTWRQPFLGAKEMVGHIVEPRLSKKPIELSREIGLIPHSWIYGPERKCLFFSARIDNGVVRVPELSAVLRENGVQA